MLIPLVESGIIRRLLPMTKPSAPNRSICLGDKARSGIGDHAENTATIQRAIAGWTTPYLLEFIQTAKSELWRKEAQYLVMMREGVQDKLSVLKAKRENRRRRRAKVQLS